MFESAGELQPATSGFLPTQHPPTAEQGFGIQPPSNPDSLRTQHEAETARTLAYALVWILAGSIVLQYGTLCALIWRNHGDAVQNFEHLFNAWLPVIAGLNGAAIGYYLSKERK
jgi:hypothetical protein